MNMGRTLANITIALCLTALSASCAHDNAYVDIDDPGMHDIELSGTNPFTVNFRASAEWYARIFYEQGDTTRWLNVTPLSGSPNITSVTIMAKSANYTGSDRHADVEIKLPGNVGTQIRVTQPAVARPRQLSGIRRTLIGGTLDRAGGTLFRIRRRIGRGNLLHDGKRQRRRHLFGGEGQLLGYRHDGLRRKRKQLPDKNARRTRIRV